MPRTTRRDPKPEPFWRDLVARWKTSGQTVAAFCAAHRVSQASFYSWRQRLAARNPGPATPAPPAVTFAPVRVVPDPTAEVILPTGVVVRVPVGADPVAVARLVAALGGAPC
jgi:transposase-like protein